MGTFQVNVKIGDPVGERWEKVSAMVDTAAAYTWIPASILAQLGVEPAFRLPFVFADGRVIEKDVTETRVRLDGQVRTTIAVFGDEGTLALLGAYTLEGLGLSVDPVNRRLVPIERFPMAPTGLPGARNFLPREEMACGRN